MARLSIIPEDSFFQPGATDRLDALLCAVGALKFSRIPAPINDEVVVKILFEDTVWYSAFAAEMSVLFPRYSNVLEELARGGGPPFSTNAKLGLSTTGMMRQLLRDAPFECLAIASEKKSTVYEVAHAQRGTFRVSCIQVPLSRELVQDALVVWTAQALAQYRGIVVLGGGAKDAVERLNFEFRFDAAKSHAVEVVGKKPPNRNWRERAKAACSRDDVLCYFTERSGHAHTEGLPVKKLPDSGRSDVIWNELRTVASALIGENGVSRKGCG